MFGQDLGQAFTGLRGLGQAQRADLPQPTTYQGEAGYYYVLPSGNQVVLPLTWNQMQPADKENWINRSPYPATVSAELESESGLFPAGVIPTPPPTPTPTPTPRPIAPTDYTPFIWLGVGVLALLVVMKGK